MLELNEFLVRTCIATADHLGDVVRLLAIQLSEHRIDLDAGRLEAAVRGVLEDPTRGFFMVLQVDARTVGAAYVSFIWALEHGGHSAWLEEIFIDPACRESGLGARFLQSVMAECEARGCAALDLEIDAGHERVRSLYRRHGFNELPRRRLVRRFARRAGA
jgi:GNAT superfamily N-acetyltransferase